MIETVNLALNFQGFNGEYIYNYSTLFQWGTLYTHLFGLLYDNSPCIYYILPSSVRRKPIIDELISVLNKFSYINPIIDGKVSRLAIYTMLQIRSFQTSTPNGGLYPKRIFESYLSFWQSLNAGGLPRLNSLKPCLMLTNTPIVAFM